MNGFAQVGARYSHELARGLSLTGETASYFATRRVTRVRELAEREAIDVGVVLDFGCGSGLGFAPLRAAFRDARIVGFEPEPALRAVAREHAAQAGVEVVDDLESHSACGADVVYCNGVFHHIPVVERPGVMRQIRAALRSGGIACVWENSPFNPGTRWIMSRISFDRDAVLLAPKTLRALQESAGLSHVATEFHFVFPRALAFLRPLEDVARPLPLGGQYVSVARA